MLLSVSPITAKAADPQQLMRILESRQCPACDLKDADLVQADLRNAQLTGAQLQGANLSGARLDGADLRDTNLRFTSLAGASLRGADLRGSDLTGTDLRQSDLTGAALSPNGLSRSHWQQAQGVNLNLQSYAELHNAGTVAAQAGQFPDSEKFFSAAISSSPNAAITWMARGIIRAEQGKTEDAYNDLLQSSTLYLEMGEKDLAFQIKNAAEALVRPDKIPRGGNGFASNLASGAVSALQLIAPIAIKALAPSVF